MKFHLKIISGIAILILLLPSLKSFAQENTKIINKHISDVNNKDVNQLYINKKVSKITELDSSSFTDGLVIKDADTLKCKIYLKKNKLTDDLYLYILAKFENSQEINVLTGKDIFGFTIKGESYFSHYTSLDTIKSYSFIKLIENGSVDLFERAAIPSNIDFVYLFKKREETNLSFIAPYTETEKFNLSSSNYKNDQSKGGGYIPLKSNPLDKKFKLAFTKYFSNCSELSNKIAAGFYTIKDFRLIVKEYNIRCN